MESRVRNNQLHFMVDDNEREIIDKKMGIIGTSNLGNYLRRMSIYGYMLEVDMQPLNSLTTELSRIGNNINQLTKRANETGNIYIDDIEKISSDISEMKQKLKEFTQYISNEIT